MTTNTNNWKSNPLLLLGMNHSELDFQNVDQGNVPDKKSLSSTATELTGPSKKIKALMEFDEVGQI
jgi:hypothetical protein